MTRAAFALAVTLVISACGGSPSVAVRPAVAAAIAPAPAPSLRADLAAIFETPQFDRMLWSVLVKTESSDVALYSLNANTLVMPGSTMKVVTLAAASELLGWDHQFETRIISTAPIEDGVLRGDLVVVGGGDPSISERSETPGVLKALARQLRDGGLTRIEGGIIGDDDLFDDRGLGSGWTLDNLPYGYAAPVSALEYNEGSVDLVIVAGAVEGDPVGIHVRPEGSGLTVDNRLTTVRESRTGRLTLHRLPGSMRVIVEGEIPAKAAPFARTASVDNPTAFFVSAFRAALIAEGVHVSGDAADIDDFLAKPDMSAARTLATHTSLPLRQLAVSMMKVSQNQYAEILLRHVGAQGAVGASATMGAQRVRVLLKTWDIADDSYVIADGSGLSRYNYVSSDMLVRLLTHVREDPQHAGVYAATLPVAGRDGPLSRRLSGTVAEGRVRAKTGTVDNVRAIAGYVHALNGETLMFSIIANNFTASTSVIDDAADRALIRLATFTGQP